MPRLLAPLALLALVPLAVRATGTHLLPPPYPHTHPAPAHAAPPGGLLQAARVRPRSARAEYQVPREIAADCSADVTAKLSAWIGSVPDSSTLRFGKDACYDIDGGLKINDRHGLTFEGNGATFRRVSRGVAQQSNFSFQGGGGLTIRNLIVRGANPNAGLAEAAYVVQIENQHGIHLASIQGALIEDVQIYDVYGDFIAMTHDYRLPAASFPGPPNRDILIRRGRFERNGRMGVAVTHGERISLEDSYIGDVRWSAFDLELDSSREIGRSIRVERNRIGPVWHYAFISAGAGTPEGVRDVTVRGNVMESVPPTCLGVIRVRGRGWPGWIVEDNRLLTRGGGLGIELTGVTGATARRNTITSGETGGCGQRAPILVQSSDGVVVAGNRLTGPWPGGLTVDSASTRVTPARSVPR